MSSKKICNAFYVATLSCSVTVIILTIPLSLFPTSLATSVGSTIRRDTKPFPRDTTPGEWRRGTSLVIDYVRGDMGESSLLEIGTLGSLPFFNDFELRHLRDVRFFCRFLKKALLYALPLPCLALLFFLIRKDLAAFGISLKKAARFAVVSIVTLALLSAADFNRTFSLFHRIVFPGGNWKFWRDDALVKLFPPNFWEGASTCYILSSILIGVLVSLLGIFLSHPFRIKK